MWKLSVNLATLVGRYCPQLTFTVLLIGPGLLSSVNAFTFAGKLKGSSCYLFLPFFYISKLILTIS